MDKVIAKQGARYLVDLDRKDARHGDEVVEVIDLVDKKRYRFSLLRRVIARGYWEPFSTTSDELLDLRRGLAIHRIPLN